MLQTAEQDRSLVPYSYQEMPPYAGPVDNKKEAIRVLLEEGDFDMDMEITSCMRLFLQLEGGFEEKKEAVAQFLTRELEHYFLEYGLQVSLAMWFFEKRKIGERTRLCQPNSNEPFVDSLTRSAETSEKRFISDKIGWQEIEKVMAGAPNNRMMAWASPPYPGLNYSFLSFFISKDDRVEACYLNNDFSLEEYQRLLKDMDKDFLLKEASTLALLENPALLPREVASFETALREVEKILNGRLLFGNKKLPGKEQLEMARFNMEDRVSYQFPRVGRFAQRLIGRARREELEKLLLYAAQEIYNFVIPEKPDPEVLDRAVLSGDPRAIFEAMNMASSGMCPSASLSGPGRISTESLSLEAKRQVEQGVCPYCGEKLRDGFCHTCQVRFDD